MKIGILGAGISGLSIARLLNNQYDVEILEKASIHGGIARTRDVNGIAYHTIGGHCFNSKHKDVLDFVFDNILPITEWNRIKRKSRIKFHNYEIDYPIEFSIRQIFENDKDLAQRITVDFFKAIDNGTYDNLKDWFLKKFGDTLAYEYFIPYNKKIWNRLPEEMDYSWVEDKLPVPNQESFFRGLINKSEDNMAHFEFYYPKSNNQNTFIDALAKDIIIHYNYEVESVNYNQISKKWHINNDKIYDIIINTTPINRFIATISNVPIDVQEAAKKLKVNGISNVLWKTKDTDKTWTYLPDSKYLFHRYIHIGSFFRPSNGYAISEVIGSHLVEEMIQSGRTDDFLIEPLDHNNSDMAYIVFDENYSSSMNIIREYLDKIGIYTLGRFGEWQYYNMDICIKKAIDMANSIKKEY